MNQSGQPLKLKHPRVVATIPCFNTERSIGQIVSETKKYVDQVVVIDDGSHDSTVATSRAAGALVVEHGTNKGYGEAVKSCFEVARTNGADILVTLDGDRQHNPEEIPRLIAPLLSGKADLVIGSRFLSGQDSMPRYRKLGVRIITFLYNLGSKVKVSDTQSGYRAYSKKIFDGLSLSEKGMGVSIEILEKACRKRAIIEEVPISCLYFTSTLNLKAIRHGLSVALSLLRIRFKNSLQRG